MKKNLKKSKKNLFLFFALFFTLTAFCQEADPQILSSADFDENSQKSEVLVPPLLSGIWQNQNRYIIFDTGYFSSSSLKKDQSEKDFIPQIVLRTFYQWYNDRAAESEEYSKKNPRDKNNTTQKSPAEKILMSVKPLTYSAYPENSNIKESQGKIEFYANEISSGAWNLEIKYHGNKENCNIPVCVIGNDLYLNFLVKNIDEENLIKNLNENSENHLQENENTLNGFWRDYGIADGIFMSPHENKKELCSLYIFNSNVYKIRYWKTDMEFDQNAAAHFSDENQTFYVPKHLNFGGQNYTCTIGKRTEIRNVKKEKLMENYRVNSVFAKNTSNGNKTEICTIIALGKPYLSLAEQKYTIEEIVKSQNSQKKPQRESPFPPHGILDFDWSIIEDPPQDYNRRMLDLGK